MNSQQRRVQRRAIERQIHEYRIVPILMWVRRMALRILARAMRNAIEALKVSLSIPALPAPRTSTMMLAVGAAKVAGEQPTYAYSNIPKIRRLG